MRNPLLATLVVALSMAAPVAAQNLVINPGFEAGDFTGWTQGGNINDTDVIPSSEAHSGLYEAYFGPAGSIGTLWQSFATTPNGGYLLQYWLDSDGTGPNTFEVLWGGTVLPSLSLTNVNLFGYNYFAANVVAAAATTTLEFRFRNDPDYWYLDDVSVTAVESEVVPEPATMTLLATGLVGMAAASRRKRQKA